ncbi:crossover junction endodeoxyribonuclease RuvC [Propioniciclava soli]|uniref:Crossover junction endodeoxyribonuclease RuvC n=1 Tax=Propioniciclava soli TaxID=2775081 RepID=A0ABZ3CCR3_9ACTN|nr:crossover junction endodeoxyribonuclease RuvC [Propioniciclava soli]
MGIDPGLTRCGIGVIEGQPGRKPALLLADVIRTPAAMETGQRLAAVERSLVRYVAEYRPDALAVERVFARRDVSSIIGTAQASGVVLLVGTRAGLAVAQHTPTEVKAAITGNGRADKAQVGQMVMRILALDAPPKPADAADAVALAVCHLWRAPAIARIAQAQQRRDLAEGRARARALAAERRKPA